MRVAAIPGDPKEAKMRSTNRRLVSNFLGYWEQDPPPRKPRPSLPIGRKVPSPGEPLLLLRPGAALGAGLRARAHQAPRTKSRVRRVPGILPVLSRPEELTPLVPGMLGTVVFARSSASQGAVKAARSGSIRGT